MSKHPRLTRLGAQTRAILQQRFPEVFVGKGSLKRPLRLGIKTDIRRACPDLNIRAIHDALADYTHGPRYARCVIEGAPRIGLDGQSYDLVKAGHAAWAAKQLAFFDSQTASKAEAA